MVRSQLDTLGARHRILRGVREFFWAKNFLEVETPVVLAHPSQEPYLEPLRTTVHDHRGRAHDGFLRMSPEFSLKKVIAALAEKKTNTRMDTAPEAHPPSDENLRNIRDIGDHSRIRAPVGVFEIGPVFRDGEPWGGSHNPEFTMLEWYEVRADYRKLMSTCEDLMRHCLRGAQHESALTINYQLSTINCVPPWERLTMCQAWQRYAKLDLDHLLTRAAMAKACHTKGYTVTKSDTFDDLFFKVHLTEVEPKLGRTRPTFLTDWPVQMAGLARRKPKDPRYAERVELYIGGLELANGFSELTDADEQLRRFRADQRLRRKLGKPVYPIDMDFIAALRHMPPTAGIALGIDRLVMLLVDAATIDEVRWGSASALF